MSRPGPYAGKGRLTMLAWAVVVSVLVGVSLVAGMQLRRQRMEVESLREQLLSVQNSFEHAVSQFSALEAHRGADILDTIEADACEMAMLGAMLRADWNAGCEAEMQRPARSRLSRSAGTRLPYGISKPR